MLPSTIYDFASGPLVDLGIQNKRSTEIPELVHVGLTWKWAGMVGPGLNIRSSVHTDDGASSLPLFAMWLTTPSMVKSESCTWCCTTRASMVVQVMVARATTCSMSSGNVRIAVLSEMREPCLHINTEFQKSGCRHWRDGFSISQCRLHS